MTSLLREPRPAVHVTPRRRAAPIAPLKLGLIRIRLRSRGDGFSWDLRERWLLWGLVQVVRYPGPAFRARTGRWTWKPACPEAGSGARWAYLGRA